MGARERRQGRWWENRVARDLRKKGILVRRGCQSGGRVGSGGDAADVEGADLPLWVEAKNGANPSPHEALLQADMASSCVIGRRRKPPVAVIRAAGKRAIACMYLHDFLDLLAGELDGNPRVAESVVEVVRQAGVELQAAAEEPQGGGA